MGEHITLTAADGFELAAYRATPESDVRGAVVVVQEIFGVNSHIRSVVDRYAAAGYDAVAPAIFDRAEPGFDHGYEPDDIAAGRVIAMQLNTDAALQDLAAAARDVSGSGRVGIVGFCFGGRLAALASLRLGDLFSAAVGYYGGGIATMLEDSPTTPLMLHFGALDHGIPLTDVEKVAAAWPAAIVHVYDGAEHGFSCDQRASYNADAADVARSRTMEFFAENL